MNTENGVLKTVHEVASLTGISVRTLHYYDQIGLLVPSQTSQAGYRLYNNTDLERLQQILFFCELDFSRKDIRKLLDNPDFDKRDALLKHKQLLQLKRDRLNGLINLVENTIKGEITMSFKEFDMTQIREAQQKYAKEAQERWGQTDAYAESQSKTAAYGKEEWAEIFAQAEEIYKGFAAHMHEDPSCPAVQQLVADWQEHITKYYYHCTKEILAGLGQMYVLDERFTKNIDKYGDGLASFMSDAIAFYTKS